MALTGRLSNTSYMGFQYSIENVVDHLTTNGITAIPGERKSIEELKGMSWNLKPPEQTSVRVPSMVAVNERLNRSDYYVRYDAPLNTIPIEEVAATGWGEEFSDDEVTPEKVTILNEVDEESDWDDDLVIQERHAQNQQDFLDKYLPQWNDLLATQKQKSELEWPDHQFGYPQGRSKLFSGRYGEYHNSQWTLPPAWTESGVMHVLPADPGLCEKLMWQQWQIVFPEAYTAFEAIADEPQNITSQVRQLILLEDPYRGEDNKLEDNKL
nr:hypothetical protein Ccrd_010332 [Tanacetum cinerariifolium]